MKEAQTKCHNEFKKRSKKFLIQLSNKHDTNTQEVERCAKTECNWTLPGDDC